MFKLKLFLLVLLAYTLFLVKANASSVSDDNEGEKKWKKYGRLAQLPYFMDDIQLIGGLNTAGLYMSDNYRNLSYAKGFQFGLESYIPVGQIIFFNYGVHFSQRNFMYKDDLFKNNFIDIPLYVSYELPVLKSVDLRFFLGWQFSYRLSSVSDQRYFEEGGSGNEYYKVDDFNRFDTGWTFGLSGEYKSIFFRARSYVGLGGISPTTIIDGKTNIKGTFNSIGLEAGYFLFRNFRK